MSIITTIQNNSHESLPHLTLAASELRKLQFMAKKLSSLGVDNNHDCGESVRGSNEVPALKLAMIVTVPVNVAVVTVAASRPTRSALEPRGQHEAVT